MKKIILKRKVFATLVLAALLFFTGCSSEQAFLELEKETITTNDTGSATIKGETNAESELTVGGKKVKTEDGTFSHKVTLSGTKARKIAVQIDFDGEEIEKEVTIKPSDQFIEAIEREEAEAVLVLAEKTPTQRNYDEAFTLISSLSNEYEDFNDRLVIVRDHIPILEAVALAEKDQTRDNLVAAQAQVEAATLNKEKLATRLSTVEKKINEKEELERKTNAAQEAITKAEQSLSDDDYNQAVTLLAEISTDKKELSERLESVNQAIINKKAEEQRQAEEAAQAQAAAAAAQAQAEADAAAQAAANAQAEVNAPVAQTVLITPTGSKYHARRCGNGSYSEATLDHALSLGLEPCSKCF